MATCKIKFKAINAFKGSSAFRKILGMQPNQEIEASSYEDLSKQLIQIFSRSLSEQQAFFKLLGTDEFVSVDNKDINKRGDFYSKEVMGAKVLEAQAELEEKLKHLFKIAEDNEDGMTIDIVLSRFMTDEIMETVLDKLDHYEKNKDKYRGKVGSNIEAYLAKTLGWLSLVLEDEKKKGTKQRAEVSKKIGDAIGKINAYLGNQIKFAFPQYVRLPYGAIGKDKHYDNFYIDSDDADSSEMIANPIDREITQSIIEIQKAKLLAGTESSFGVARVFREDDNIIYKLYRAKAVDGKIVYEDVENRLKKTNRFSLEEDELFRPDNNKVSPFSVNGEADFTNFVANFDGIIPKRVGNKRIPEHNPDSLKISVSNNVSVLNNIETEAVIKSVLGSLTGKTSSVFSNIPAFIAGRERYLVPNTSETVTTYVFENGELKQKQVPFTKLVTKGLNQNIDIILFEPGDNDTFVGDYDPMNYVEVTSTGVRNIKLEELEDESFITDYFSLPPGIRINNTKAGDAVLADLIEIFNGNVGLAEDKLRQVLEDHKGVLPLQFISTLSYAVAGLTGKSDSGEFLTRTIKSFREKVAIVNNAKNQLGKQESKTLTLGELGVTGHRLEIYPNILKNEYSEDFDLGGEFQGVQVFTYKNSNGKVIYKFRKEGKFLQDSNDEAILLTERVSTILNNQTGFEHSNQITLLHYSGTGSNLFVPMFMSVKPLEDKTKDAFLFAGKVVTDGGKTETRISVPVNSLDGQLFIGGFEDEGLLRLMNGPINNEGSVESKDESLQEEANKFFVLGLLMSPKAKDTFMRLGYGVVDRNMLITALTDYFMHTINGLKVMDPVTRKKVIPEDVLVKLNKTFLFDPKFAKGYTNRKFIEKKMALVADVLATMKETKLSESVKEVDFVTNKALSKLRHNIDTANPINRVLRFNSVGRVVDPYGESKIENIETFIPKDEEDFQFEKEAEYKGDRDLDSLEARQEFLRQIAGDATVMDVDSVNERAGRLAGGNVALGAVIDAVVYMDEQLSTQGNFYHEAGHRVFDYLLTREEQEIYMAEARKIEFNPETINAFLQGRGLPTNSDTLDLFYREQIMNMFAQYKLSRDRSTFIGAIGNWLVDLFDTLLDWLHIARTPSLNNLFRNIDKGKYKDRVPGKVEPRFQNLVTKNVPLSTDDTSDLFYHLFGVFTMDGKYSEYFEKYKRNKEVSTLKLFIQKQETRSANITKKSDIVTSDVVKNVLKIQDDYKTNINLFKKFLDERLSGFEFTPDAELELFDDGDGAVESDADEDGASVNDKSFGDAKYNSEVFVEAKVKNFINAVVSPERIVVGKNDMTNNFLVVYKKLNNSLINKAQKDFSVVPIGSNKFQHFLTFLDGFARYDLDYAKLRDYIHTQFQITKEDGKYVVGDKAFFLDGLINNFSQNRLYYSKVIITRGAGKDDIFNNLEEQELILDNNVGSLTTTFGNMGRVPKVDSANYFFQTKKVLKDALVSSTDAWEVLVEYVREGKEWYQIYTHPKDGIKKELLSGSEIKNIYDARFGKMNFTAIAKDLQTKMVEATELVNQYKKNPSNAALLDKAVKNLRSAYSLLGVPVTGSYAYIAILNETFVPSYPGEVNSLSAISTINATAKILLNPAYAGILSKPLKRKSKETKEFIKALRELETSWFHAIVNGTNISYNSVKGVDKKSYYAYSYSNITEKLEKSADERFASNDLIRAPYFRIANTIVKGSLPIELKNAYEADFFASTVALYRKGFFNLDQLEGNSTNFSVKGQRTTMVTLGKKTIESKNPNVEPVEVDTMVLDKLKIGKALSQMYKDVSDKMLEFVRLYEELQTQLNEVVTQEEREEIIAIFNDKYELALDVSAITLEDLVPGTSQLSDDIYRKRGFNTFFSLLPLRQFTSKDEVLDYAEEVKSDSFYTQLADKAIGKFTDDNLFSDGSMAHAYWEFMKKQSGLIPKNLTNKLELQHKIFIANMVIDYLLQTHNIYKKILGEEYFHAFKNSWTGEFNKRLKALGIFGQSIDEGRFIEVDDTHELVNKPKTSDWKEDNAYTSKEVEKTRGVTTIEATDGFGYATFERIIQIQKSKSRLDDRIFSYYISLLTDGRFIYDKDVQVATVEKLKELHKYAKNTGAINGLFKTALGAAIAKKFRYHKMAYAAFERSVYMIPKEGVSKEQLDNAYLEVAKATVAWINDYSTSSGKIEAYKAFYALHEPIVGQEKLFEKYEKMETENLQVTVSRSASKSFKTDKVINVPYGAEKHQTENTNLKLAIAAATQAEASLLNDQGDGTARIAVGSTVKTAAEVISDYLETKDNLNSMKGSVVLGTLIKDGKIDPTVLSAYLKKYVTVTKNKEHLKELFNLVKTDTGYTFSSPPDSPEAIRVLLQLIAKITNEINSTKIKGDAYGLMPSTVYSVMEDENGYVPLGRRPKVATRRLQPRQLIFDGKWNVIPFTNKQEFIDSKQPKGLDVPIDMPIMEVHEMVVPAHELWQKEYVIDRARMREGKMTKEQLDLKYPLELFLVYGTRVPHEEKRSAFVGMIIDFLPSTTGSVAIIPTIKMDEDGHDHDNDKAYVSKPHIVEEGGGWRIKKTPVKKFADRIADHPFLREFIKTQIENDPHLSKLDDDLQDSLEQLKGIRAKLTPSARAFEELVDAIDDSVSDAKKREIVRKEIKEYLTAQEEENDELNEKKDKINQIKKRIEIGKALLMQGHIENVRNYNRDNGLEHTESLDLEVEENNLLAQFISLHSNRQTLESGVLREKTDLGFAERWTKNELKKHSQSFVYEVIGSALRVARNQFKAYEGGQGISISAKFQKTLVDLKQMKANLGSVTIGKMKFKSIESSAEYENAGYEFVEILNKEIVKYNETSDIKLDLINPSIELYKLNNLKTSIYVSINTDSIKNMFGRGLNLNKITYGMYSIGTAYNIPQTILMTICSSALMRQVNTLQELKDYLDNLNDAREEAVKGALTYAHLKTDLLYLGDYETDDVVEETEYVVEEEFVEDAETLDAEEETQGTTNETEEEKGPKLVPLKALSVVDLLNAYFAQGIAEASDYDDYVFTKIDGKKVYALQPGTSKRVLTPQGMLRLKLYTLANNLNNKTQKLFSIGSVTNSNKHQLLDQILQTTSLLNQSYDNTVEDQIPAYAVLGLNKPVKYIDKPVVFKYKEVVPKSRRSNVVWDARVVETFRGELDINKDHGIPQALNEKLGTESLNTSWYAGMSKVMYNSNAKYDITRLPALKKKLDALHIKYDFKLSLLRQLKWENGIFFIQKEDKFDSNIVNYQAELAGVSKEDERVLVEFLQATRYIWGWADTSFSPINYFPGNITSQATQEISDNPEDYTKELERELKSRVGELKGQRFPNYIKIPSKFDKVPVVSPFLDHTFANRQEVFRLTNIASNSKFSEYMFHGLNLYRRTHMVARDEGNDKIKRVTYSMVYVQVRPDKQVGTDSQSFNPYTQARLTPLDTFRLNAEVLSLDIDSMPLTMIYNNHMVVVPRDKEVEATAQLFKKKIIQLEKFTNKVAEIGVVLNKKDVDPGFTADFSTFWANTVFDELSKLKKTVLVFEVETDFPQNELFLIAQGDITKLPAPSDTNIANTFAKVPEFSKVFTNIDLQDDLSSTKEDQVEEQEVTEEGFAEYSEVTNVTPQLESPKEELTNPDPDNITEDAHDSAPDEVKETLEECFGKGKKKKNK